MAEHVILAAFQVEAPNRVWAQQEIIDLLPSPTGKTSLLAWWIAEQDRIDGSDNDSAVFVPYRPS